MWNINNSLTTHFSKLGRYDCIRRENGKAKNEISQPDDGRSREELPVVNGTEIVEGITNVTN